MAKRKRGRPCKSEVRQNIIEMLYFIKKMHGYDAYKVYVQLFPKVTQRLIYYHLSTGAKMDIFKIEKIRTEQGTYSWGASAERVYYSLGEQAAPTGRLDIKEKLEKKGLL